MLGPKLAYCPRANSKKNNGSPTRSKHIAYGIRNAPTISKICITPIERMNEIQESF